MNYSFIVGCARSGTSILGELVASHPEVKYIFEASHIWELGGMGKNESHRLTAQHVTAPVKKQIREWFESQAEGTSFLVEKNPRNSLRIPYVKEIFPGAKFIHIVRDGRDVACSMVPGCGGAEWNHLKPPSWQEYYKKYTGAIRCAYAWKQVLDTALDDLTQVPHIQIRYEDLLASPLLVARSIFNFLNLDFHVNTVEFCKKIVNDTSSSYHAKYQDRWYRNDHRKRIGRWRENLNEKEQETINDLLDPLLTRLGYTGNSDTDTPGFPASEKKARGEDIDVSDKRLIVVLGMHRSGTSVTARALQVLGVDLGDKLLPPLEGINEKGFWEDVDLNSLNIEMLNAIHSDWHFLTPIQQSDVTELHRQGFLSRAVEMLKVKTSDISVFGFKDPRTAKLLPFWKDVFVQSQMDVSYIISMRNPLSVCKSLATRDGFDFEKSYLLWLDHVINSLIETDGKSRVLVDYDHLIQSPDTELERIAGELQLEIDLDELENFKEKFLDMDLRHTVHQFDDLMADDSAPPLVKEIYSEVLNITLNTNELNNVIPVQKITQWKNEHYRQKTALMLADKLTLKMHQNLTEFSLRVAEQDQQIGTLTVLARELSDIKSSRSWRIYLRLIDPVRRLFPPNSSQLKLFDLAWKGIREIYRNGIRSFVFKATPHVKSAVWKALKRRKISPETSKEVYIRVNPVSMPAEIVPRDCPIDIVVCVHDALADVTRCLEAIEQFTKLPYRLILVDDGSSPQTREYLQDFAHDKEHCILMRNEQARGYTRAANMGLKSSTADFVVLLNSDTVVGLEWLDRLYAALISNDQYGVAGPLSNTASWQSIPKLEVAGDWAENPLPAGMSVEQMSRQIAQYSGTIRPEAKLLNGFCMLIRRAVIDSIGYFDEEHFGEGYGEEDDFNLRARSAGWKLVIADDVYIHHAQSKSYSHERRRLLSQRAGQKLREKHGAGVILEDVQFMHPNRVMEGIRARTEVLTERIRFLDRGRNEFAGKKVLFVLPIVDAGGGGNVVVDEAKCMQKMGVDVSIFNLAKHREEFLKSYPHLDLPVAFGGEDSLIHSSFAYDAMIATANYSVEWLKPVWEKNKNITLGYYVQGFEVLMYNEGTKDAERALASYSLIDDMKLFAKTEWVRNMVLRNSGRGSANIGVSINTDLFRPRHARQLGERPVVIVAMVRPGSPYRNPKLTMNVLRKIERKYKYNVDIRLFGSDDVRDPGMDVPTDFLWTQAGKLAQPQVANLLSDADVFVDFSSHQAMGLTVLEAMACGCAVIVPQYGGAIEFIRDRENGLVVDTNSQDACYEALKLLVENDDLRKSIQLAGIRDVAQYYPESASYKILKCLFTKK